MFLRQFAPKGNEEEQLFDSISGKKKKKKKAWPVTMAPRGTPGGVWQPVLQTSPACGAHLLGGDLQQGKAPAAVR